MSIVDEVFYISLRGWTQLLSDSLGGWTWLMSGSSGSWTLAIGFLKVLDQVLEVFDTL